jgi:hypothetical protein
MKLLILLINTVLIVLNTKKSKTQRGATSTHNFINLKNKNQIMTQKELQTQIKCNSQVTSLWVAKPNRHICNALSLGRVFPTTKAQAMRVYSRGSFDVLYLLDVDTLIEPLLNKHGFAGDYNLTKSNRFCRLNNFADFKKALKAEYNF